MRFVATPRRTPRRGSLCVRKNSSSAAASAEMSRTSPETTMPLGSGLRASCSSRAVPLFATRDAASCEAPILSPTSSPRRAFAAPAFLAVAESRREVGELDLFL